MITTVLYQNLRYIYVCYSKGPVCDAGNSNYLGEAQIHSDRGQQGKPETLQQRQHVAHLKQNSHTLELNTDRRV